MGTITPRINGSLQTGTTISTTGWNEDPPAKIKKGAIFTIDGIYPSHSPDGRLQQFSVDADAIASSSGSMILTIKPAIVATGAGATVNSVPEDGAILTFWDFASMRPPPLTNPITGPNGQLTPAWASFFNDLYRRLGGTLAPSNATLHARVEVDVQQLRNQIQAVVNDFGQGPLL